MAAVAARKAVVGKASVLLALAWLGLACVCAHAQELDADGAPAEDAAAVAALAARLDLEAETARPGGARERRQVVPAVPGTIARLQRNSPRQAREALRRARHVMPRVPSFNISKGFVQGEESEVVRPAAICGANSLMPTNYIQNCRIVMTYNSGPSPGQYTCSAFKIGNRLLGTAGHCVYNGAFVSSMDVYCTGSRTCGVARTTVATHVITTPKWVNTGAHGTPNAWDGAVIRTADTLPGTAYRLAQVMKPGGVRVRLTGFPAQNPSSQSCNDPSFAGACSQFSSTDVMQAVDNDMDYSQALDLCGGHSGSGVTETAGGYAVAVVSGASDSPCINLFVPQINSGNVDPKTCERARGGVSLTCLANKLPA